MYGIKNKFDCNLLLGQSLEEVSLTSNGMTLSFSNRILITIESEFACGDQVGFLNIRRTVPTCSSKLIKAIDSIVERSEIINEGTLVLHFSSGISFACFDNSDIYESYRISIDGKEIIV